MTMNSEHWLEKGLIVVIIIVAVILIIILRSEAPCSDEKKIPALIEVQDGELKYVGFNTDTTELNFGKVSPGAVVRRSIKVEFSQYTDVQVTSTGEIASWMTIDHPSFTLLNGKRQEVTFEVTVPNDLTDGVYTGEVNVCFES